MTDLRRRGQYPHVSESGESDGDARLAAFHDLYDRQFSYVYKTVRRFGVPSGDAADAVQEVFVVVFRRWGELDLERPIRPWLFGVARRVAAAHRRRGTGPEGPNPESLAAGGTDADQDLARRELLWAALGQVDEGRCAVFILHELEGYTAPEIGRILDIPTNTVYSRLRIARKEVLEAVRTITGGMP